MLKYCASVPALGFAPLFCGLAVASSLPIETVEVVGTRSGLPLAQLSGQISVIDRDQIDALNKDTVQQLLQSLTGVSINQQGGAGGVSSLYVRGGEANFAVVMIDGIQVNNPVDTRGGSFDFSTIDMSQIQRIELIRGPQSAIYGADAMSGVVNIVTRQAGDSGGSQLRMELGDDNYYRVSASFTGTVTEHTSYSLSAGRSDAGHVVNDSKREVNFLSGDVLHQVNDRAALLATVQYSQSDRSSLPEDSGGSRYAVWRTLEHGEADNLAVKVAWNYRARQWWSYSLEARWFSLESKDTSPGIYPGTDVPPTGSDTNFNRYQLSYVNRLQWNALQLNLGVDGKHEDGDSNAYIEYGVQIPADFNLSRNTLGTFAELNYDLSEALVLSWSVRYDDPEQAKSELTQRAGALLRLPDKRTEFRANWGEGFKPPSFFALAHPLVGNPYLQPETASGWDLGVSHRLDMGLALNLVYFSNEYRNLIDFDDELFTNVNRDRVENSGLEFTFDYTFGGGQRVHGHATYLDMGLAGDQTSLRGRPKWKSGLQWFVPLREDLELTAAYLWVGKVTEASLYTGESRDYTLPSYSTLDLNLNWTLNPQLELQVAVSNLLDENYEQAVGFPSPGTFARIALQLSF